MSSSWRTTRELVAGILQTDPAIVLGDLSGLDPFIDTANAMVSALCAPNPEPSAAPPSRLPPYSLSHLELIERWWSAHYYAVRDPSAGRVTSERAGDVAQTFGGLSGTAVGLNATIYGQQVLRLDYRLNLASLEKRVEEGINPQPGVINLGGSSRWRGGPGCQ